MKRRLVLTGVGLTLSTLISGCLSENEATDTEDTTTTAEQDTGDETETDDGGDPTSAETGCTDRPAVAENIMIVLLNRTATEQLVHVTLSTDDDTLLDAKFTVAPNAKQPIYTGITETGQYELSIAVEDGPATSTPLSIEEYDLEMGSNLIAEIFEDKMRVMIEE